MCWKINVYHYFLLFQLKLQKTLGKSYGNVFWTLWIGAGIKKGAMEQKKKKLFLGGSTWKCLFFCLHLTQKYSEQHTERRESGRHTNWWTGDGRARNEHLRNTGRPEQHYTWRNFILISCWFTYTRLLSYEKKATRDSAIQQMVNVMKENSYLRQRRHKEKTTIQDIDETDMFLLSMAKMMKILPSLEQQKLNCSWVRLSCKLKLH